jgi:PAS domain S-box-containing protein
MFSRKKAERASADGLNYIINNLPDLIIRINRDREITFINSASVVFLNRTPEEVTGKTLHEIFNDLGREVIPDDKVDQVFTTHNADIIETVLPSGEPDKVVVEVRILPDSPSNGLPDQVIMILRDITRRKEAEKKLIQAKQHAEESDKLKSAFLANMSHEIRTPLNAIVGFSQIILEEDLGSEERSKYFEYIYQNSNQLISLVNDIIDISKLESKQLIIRDSTFNLNQLLSEVLELAENEKKIRMKSHVLIIHEKELNDDQAFIESDPYRLRQILTNLLVNAIKFTPKGYIQFGYRLKDAKYLLFYVRDTGIGIPPDKHAEAFQYFRQLENTLTRSSAGTGLGLAICKNLVELMGGNIWLQSEVGKGTTFFFTLPYKKAHPGGMGL